MDLAVHITLERVLTLTHDMCDNRFISHGPFTRLVTEGVSTLGLLNAHSQGAFESGV